MQKTYGYLERKTSMLMIVFSTIGIRIVYISKRVRTKMLRSKRVWWAKIGMREKGYSVDYTVELIRRWWESMDEEELFERLTNSPEDSKPIIFFDNMLFVDFNVRNGTAFLSEIEREILEQDD